MEAADICAHGARLCSAETNIHCEALCSNKKQINKILFEKSRVHLLLFIVFSTSCGSLGDGGSIPGRVGVGRHQVCFRFLLCIEHCDIM